MFQNSLSTLHLHLWQNLKVVLYVYFIGFYYFIYECLIDCKIIKLSDDLYDFNELKDNFEKDLTLKEENNDKQRVLVVTGGDGTIGCKILEIFYSLNFFIISVGLKRPKELPTNGHFIQCNLSDIEQLKECVEKISTITDHIDVLICNAGIMLTPINNWTIEPHLAINMLAHAFIFNKLRNLLEHSSWEHPRAIFVSSSTCHAGSIAEYLTGSDYVWQHRINGYKAYADSKLMISLYVKYLANLLENEKSKIFALSVHPGVVPGGLYKNVNLPLRFIINIILAPYLRSSRSAAHYICRLVIEENIISGAYYENGIPVDLALPTEIIINNEIKRINETDACKLLGKCIEKRIAIK